MPPSTLSLWSTAIRPAIQSPYAVLSAQAEELAKQTNHLLVGELTIGASEDKKKTVLLLDMYAPTLDYRHRVLSASHDKSLVYPVVINADIFRPRTIGEIISQTTTVMGGFSGSRPEKRVNEAASDEELIKLVKQVLISPEVVSIAVSLIAKSEDAIREKEKASQTILEIAGAISHLARTDDTSVPDEGKGRPEEAG